MKYVSTVLSLVFLSACESSIDSTTLSSTTTESITTSSTPSVSSGEPIVTPTPTTPTPGPTQFLYVLVAGKVCAYPIDSDTKDLIQPEAGSWCVASTSGNFYSMTIDPSGKFLYASNAVQAKIYQYAITQDYMYATYGSNIPLTALSTPTFATNISSGYMAFGSNGNLYIDNNNYSPARLDKINLSAAGLLTYSATVVAATEIASYGMTMAHVTSVTSGSETYVIDVPSNTIHHYTDGVLQSSFQSMIVGTLKTIQLK